MRPRGASEQRRMTRCLSWRRDGSFRRSASSGCPTRIDVHELRRGRLEVRQQPDLLEQLVGEALRLVDDHGGRAACLVPLEQVALERQQEPALRTGGAGEAEPVGENLVELRRRQRRVVQDSKTVLRAPLRLQRRAKQRGLAGASFAEQQRDAQRRSEPVAERGEGLAMNRVQKEEPRVRRELEGRFVEPEEGFVHFWMM